MHSCCQHHHFISIIVIVGIIFMMIIILIILIDRSKAKMPIEASSSNDLATLARSIMPVKKMADPKLEALQNALYVNLMNTRRKIAEETGFTPHSIASNKVLLDMAKFRYLCNCFCLSLSLYSYKMSLMNIRNH